MRVCIFGASGRTGTLLTERCLAAGYEVTALLRSPEKYPLRERVRVVQGSVFDAEAVRRIIALGGASAKADSASRQPALVGWMITRLLYDVVLKWPSAGQRSQWKTLAASGLDFTMVMPPMLTGSAGRGRYRVDGEALPPRGARIAREDVADFMMQQIGSPQWVGKGVYIAW